MSKVFFNENGILSIDEGIEENSSFKKIMEDEIVTEQELQEQVQLVTSLYEKVEDMCNPEQKEAIKQLIAETGVLYAVYQYHELQSFKTHGNIQ